MKQVNRESSSQQSSAGQNRPCLGGMTSEELLRISEEVSRFTPSIPTVSELVLMEVSPHRLYAYWHINEADLDQVIADTHSDMKLVLEVKEVSDGQKGTKEGVQKYTFTVQGGKNSRYVDVLKGGEKYKASLAVETGKGELLTVVRSNCISLPRGRESEVYTARAVDTGVADSFHEEFEDVRKEEAVTPKPVDRGDNQERQQAGADTFPMASAPFTDQIVDVTVPYQETCPDDGSRTAVLVNDSQFSPATRSALSETVDLSLLTANRRQPRKLYLPSSNGGPAVIEKNTPIRAGSSLEYRSGGK